MQSAADIFATTIMQQQVVVAGDCKIKFADGSTLRIDGNGQTLRTYESDPDPAQDGPVLESLNTGAFRIALIPGTPTDRIPTHHNYRVEQLVDGNWRRLKSVQAIAFSMSVDSVVPTLQIATTGDVQMDAVDEQPA